MEKTTEKTAAGGAQGEAKNGAAAHNAADPTAPMRALVETALDEYKAQVDRWLDHGAAQVAESYRVMKAWNAGAAAALRAQMEQVATLSASFAADAQKFQAGVQIPGADFFKTAGRPQ